tara:strand:- start:50 stop:1294 length:1245 start_codon:yes stop_codon:yes gene_type:complete
MGRRRSRNRRRNRTRARTARSRARRRVTRRAAPSRRRNVRRTPRARVTRAPRATAARPSAPRAKAAPSGAPKSRQQRMRDAARARHANFKKTRVQTHGGTRKNYSAREARRIRDAGLNFSKVTGGAKNPIAKAPINPNIKVGELMPGVAGFGMANADKFMSAAPNVNYNFSGRDTSLPSMRTLSKADLSGFSKRLGIDRNRLMSGARNAFSGSPSDLGYNMRNMFQAKDLGNMTTNAINSMVDKLPFGERLPNIRPMSMADRDRQTYLGFNPNKGGRYLSQADRPKTMQMGGDRPLVPSAATPPTADEAVVEEEVTTPTENTVVDPDIKKIQDDAYNENYNPTTTTPGSSGSGTTSGGGLGMGVLSFQDLVGNRGRKRFRYGRRRGGQRLFSRGSDRFANLKNLPTFTFKGLNI